jgi:NAD(P)-dependent dehydrogenase (short-subunit alcohol dehydrogenase family)
VNLDQRRCVVVTGASRGLGLATSAHLYERGWTVVAAMRTPDVGMKQFAERLGASFDEQRLIGVGLDLDDASSIDRAASVILDRVGPPDGIVHNAGVAGVGAVEEMPVDVVEDMFRTNLFGPIRLTRRLLPVMRSARRGRIVIVSSVGALRGMAAISAYSASKGALERWAESLSMEVAPFGLGVTVLVVGTFKTDILELTPTWKDASGAYGPLHAALEATGETMLRIARRPERFAPAVERALDDWKPFCRRPVGVDAALMYYAGRILPARTMQSLLTRVLRLPRM